MPAPVPPTPTPTSSAAAAQAAPVRKSDEPPVLLVRWYEVVKWLLERAESFPKNQRFIFGQRVADAALDSMDLLVEAAYRKEKREVLVRANLRLERLRWLLQLARERNLLTARQQEFIAEQFLEVDRVGSNRSTEWAQCLTLDRIA